MQKEHACLQQRAELDRGAAEEKLRLQKELLEMREQVLRQSESVAAAQQSVIDELQEKERELQEKVKASSLLGVFFSSLTRSLRCQSASCMRFVAAMDFCADGSPRSGGLATSVFG